MKIISAFFLILVLGGCSLMPDSLRYAFRGTPAERAQKAAKKAASAQTDLVAAVQDDVIVARDVMDGTPNERRDEVIKNFLDDASKLIGEHHPVTKDHEAQLAAFADRLLSDDLEVRAKADLERQKNAQQNEALSQRYFKAEQDNQRLAAKLAEKDAENAHLALYVKRFAWTIGAIIIFFVLGQALSIAARFFPALSIASTAVNSIAAPAVQFAYRRAKVGLQKVGAAVTELRATLPAAAATEVTRVLDDHLDSDHKAIVSSAAQVAAVPTS